MHFGVFSLYHHNFGSDTQSYEDEMLISLAGTKISLARSFTGIKSLEVYSLQYCYLYF